MNNKDDILYNLRQIERLLSKTLFLVEEDKRLNDTEYNLHQIKRKIVDEIFDIEETI